MMKSGAEIKAEQALALASLIDWVGNKNRLAKELGVSRQAVDYWIKRGRISATYAIEVEQRTAGKFTKEQLRPDVVEWRTEV